MARGEIVGLASVNLSEELVWETEADWDAAAAEEDVIHPSATIQLAIERDGFAGYTQGNSPPAPWTDPNNSDPTVANNSTPYDTNTVRFDQDPGNDVKVLFNDAFTANEFTFFEFAYNEDQASQTGILLYIEDGNGTELVNFGTNNPEVEVNDANGQNILKSSFNNNYQEWRRCEITIDWSNDTFDFFWEDEDGTETDVSYSGDLITPNDGTVAEVGYKSQTGGSGLLGVDIDIASGIFIDGFLTSATKTFSSPTQPDIASSSYSLNGEAITLDIIGSPGTGSEETVQQSLDGSSSFSLSWSNSHTDFRVEPNFSTGSGATTPTFSSVRLS